MHISCQERPSGRSGFQDQIKEKHKALLYIEYKHKPDKDVPASCLMHISCQERLSGRSGFQDQINSLQRHC